MEGLATRKESVAGRDGPIVPSAVMKNIMCALLSPRTSRLREWGDPDQPSAMLRSRSLRPIDRASAFPPTLLVVQQLELRPSRPVVQDLFPTNIALGFVCFGRAS